jgi:GT2 family glycosyltransferase/glycosyltransferase involved in cell wall biosynthesis
MAIKGHVDGMQGSYVVGWAVAEPDTGNCAITITDAQGETIAKGRASRHRPDLASLGLGRTTLAFRIPITHTPEPRLLHILANGEALPGSPILVGKGQFDGYCAIEAAMVTGWITERARGFVPPAISVLNQHGVEVGRGISTLEPANIDPLFTPARFAIELDDQCFGAGEIQLSVLANGVPYGSLSCNLKLQGNLETITAQNCSGWLISPDAPRRSFEIELFRDGVRAGTARCEHVREDVRGIYPDCETAGFSFALDRAAHSITEAITVSLRLPGSNTELFNGPYVVASRPAAVAAAYRAARLANMGLPGIGAAEQAVLQLALAEFLASARKQDGFTAPLQADPRIARQPGPRLAIIIPIYRGVEITRACIESVLAHRNAETDHLVLINDGSPEPLMAGMLAPYGGQRNVFLLTNHANMGFVQTVNRGMSFAAGGDVLLLNSDTVVHEGAFDELIRVAYGHGEIGTVTAISNNATIFSYPSTMLRRDALPDITWPDLARMALAENAGVFVDVPTGHGFCMFIKGEVIRRIGFLDEGFGRGYGEENDFCARSAALGYRHVAAGGVLVEHKESISFTNEKASLLAQNLPRLNALYPEYTPIIMNFEREDGLRATRWALDRVRLKRAVASGKTFALVVSNALEGGTAKAISDLERSVGYGGAQRLSLRNTSNGLIELAAEDPLILASFMPDETGALFDVLSAAAPTHVLVHQMLGFPAQFISAFSRWAAGRHSVFYAHDFYSFCPRVTMIDAIGRFCDAADTDTCGRCVEMGGSHEASRLTGLTPAEHRAMFSELLGGFRHVIAPSANAAGYVSRALPGVKVETIAHPESLEGVAAHIRAGTDDEIIMLGAIGPHKGSGKLLEIARRARLTHPHLQFRVIGYTDIDKQLKDVGNVTVTGKFQPEELKALLARARGRLALFLSSWPETYSYTLSEIVKHGFIPMLPDIGAPAERVRAARYGVVFPFPANAETVLRLIDDIATGRVEAYAEGASPSRFFPSEESLLRAAEVMMPLPAAPAPPAAAKKRSRR